MPRNIVPSIVYQQPSRTVTTTVTYITYKATASVVYRTGAGISYKKAGTIAKGKTVQVESGYSKTADSQTWYRVRINSKNYYAPAKNLKSTGKKTKKSTKKKVSGSKKTANAMLNYMTNISYTDPATGESDTIGITVCNRDLKWLNNWAPAKGDVITAKIKLKNWDSDGKTLTFDCGKFCCDDVSYSGPSLTCDIGGTSVPKKQGLTATARTKTWKKVTIRQIASRIAKRYSLTLKYDASTIKISSMEQTNQTDSDFLNKLCEDYGLNMKVYYGKLIIYDAGRYESKKSVKTYSIKDLDNWSYNTTLTGTYTGATIKYTSGSSNKETKLTVGKSGRLLTISEKVDSKSDAQKKACAKVNKENRSAETMSCRIKANPKIVAGVNIKISGAGNINGKYFVDKVTHNLGTNDFYTMDLDLHKVQTRIRK